MRCLPSVLLLALVPSLAGADTLVFHNGTRLEGIAVVEGDSIELRFPQGSYFFPGDVIARIERGATPLAEYESRKARLAARDSSGHYDLALFCEAHGMKTQARDLFSTVIGIDPGHDAARRKLGYRHVGGQWTTREEQMTELGLVQERGEWMSPGAAAMLRALDRRAGALEARVADLERQNWALLRVVDEARHERSLSSLATATRIQMLSSEVDSLRRSRHTPPVGIVALPLWYQPSAVISAGPRGEAAPPASVTQPLPSSAQYPFRGPR